MDIIYFSKLFQRRPGYSLPVLIELKHPEKITWYFTNNKVDIEWGGNIYKSVPMNYKFPSSNGGVPSGGTLEIDIDQQKEDGYELLRWFDEANDNTYLNVAALINEEEIVSIGHQSQKHGTVNWDGEKITWNPGTDDRLYMQINPYLLDTDALTG